ncbi:MAG: hypothetical protein AB1Z63_00605 [Candidatus Limnocylindrales bacterium]
MSDRALHTQAQLPNILAVGALVLAAIGSAAGLFVPDLYRDTEAWVREAQATDLVTLVLAVPLLALSLRLVRRGDVRWGLVAAGALWYLAYSYAIFAFSVAPNELSLLYIAVLGLSAWSLVLRLSAGDERSLSNASPRLPLRATGVFLLAVPVLFGLLWLGEITGAASASGPSEALVELGLPTNPIWPLDLAFALPVVAYGGIRLLRSDARALATALPALAFLIIIGLAVLAVFVFDIAAGADLEPVPMLIVGTITAIAVALGLTAMLPDSPEA